MGPEGIWISENVQIREVYISCWESAH